MAMTPAQMEAAIVALQGQMASVNSRVDGLGVLANSMQGQINALFNGHASQHNLITLLTATVNNGHAVQLSQINSLIVRMDKAEADIRALAAR